MEETELQRGVEREAVRGKELGEDVETVPVLPLHGELVGGQHLLVVVARHGVRRPDVAGQLQRGEAGARQQLLEDGGRVARRDAGEVRGQRPVLGRQVRVRPEPEQRGDTVQPPRLRGHHQGRGAVLGPEVDMVHDAVIRGPDTGVGDQNLADPLEPLPGCEHERGEVVVVAADDPGLVLEEVSHQLQPLLALLARPPHGGVQRGLAPHVAVVHPGAPPHQPPRHRRVGLHLA